MIPVAIVLTVALVLMGILAVAGVVVVHPGGYLFLWGALGWMLMFAVIFDRESGA